MLGLSKCIGLVFLAVGSSGFHLASHSRLLSVASRTSTLEVAMVTCKELQAKVRKFQTKDRVATLQRFFKTGKGEYGENDKFLGVYNPQLRGIVKETEVEVPLHELEKLLASPYNEERALSLMFLADYFKRAKGNEQRQREIFDFYCSQTHRINNWNLVDISCYFIVGEHLFQKPRDLLLLWCKSESLWERRIAVVSTMAFIRQGDFSTTLELARQLLDDPEELIHKAVGWMLREIGKRDVDVLHKFLLEHAFRMPRVMLRYSIEKLKPSERTKYLNATESLLSS